MKQVFHTTAKYWVSEGGSAFVLSPGQALLAYWLGQQTLAVVCLLIFFLYLPPAYKLFRARLEIDEQSIAFFDGRSVTRVQWREVIYAELADYTPKKSLVLDVGNTEDQTEIEFPIGNFDYQQVWRLVQELTPPSAPKEWRRNRATYRAWAAEQVEAVNRATRTLRVSDSWLVRIGSWVVLMLGLSVFGLFILAEQHFWRHESNPPVALLVLAAVGLFFTWLGLSGLLTSGKTEFDRDKITRRILLGTYQIRWNEITMVEECESGGFVIYCRDGYLSFPTPSWWSGKDRWESWRFWDAQIELRNIEIRKRAISFKVARNTKIK